MSFGTFRYPRRAVAAVVVLAGLGACSDGRDDRPDANPGIDEIHAGILDHYGAADAVLNAPSSVAAGADFSVSIRTYGGGCDSVHATSVTELADGLLIEPFDRTYLPPDVPTDPPITHPCPSVLLRLDHAATLRFDTVGEKRLVIRGRKVANGIDVRKELSRMIHVE